MGTFEVANQIGVVGPCEESPKMNAGWFLDGTGVNSKIPSCCKRVHLEGPGSEVLSRSGGLGVMVLTARLGWGGMIDLESLSTGNAVFAMPSSRVDSSNALTGWDCSEVLRFF